MFNLKLNLKIILQTFFKNGYYISIFALNIKSNKLFLN